MATGAPTSVVAGTARSLLSRLAGSERRAAVTFAGQGAAALTELAVLVAQRPDLRDGLEVANGVLADAVGSSQGQASGRFRHGLDLAGWTSDPDGAPPPEYLHSAAISFPLILVSQALLWRALWEDGVCDAVRANAVVACAGHSQGLLASLLVAEAGRDGVDDALLARYVRLAWTIGTHAAASTHPGAEPPMAAVSGVRRERLQPLIDEVNAGLDAVAHASVALVNTPIRLIVAGPPATLAVLRARLAAQAREEQRARHEGVRGGAPLSFAWSGLDAGVAFHTPALVGSCDELVRRLHADPALVPDPHALALPVLSPVDGRDLRSGGDLARSIARALLVEPVRWDAVCAALAEHDADWVLDLGPGTDVATLTAENLRGDGARTLALASPEGRRRLTSAGASPAAPDTRYASFAPSVAELPDGRQHLDGRYARLTGRPPVILAGMTPTTADAPIVAAAANAGYMAELAGGGQPDRWTFERRMEELGGLLEPGREVAFNTLLLDRHLWELHLGHDALVIEARRGGAPLAGVTVSAGIPEVEEAVALLDALSAAGLHLNAFKPGTIAQIRQVLAIADAAPQHTIAVHVEGGHGGGHHSWEELDELLLATYHELRRRDNVLVCAAGGVADPARAAELLCGTWARRHGERAMPVDAVLVGTAAMACCEAAASPAVKAALVAASGSDDWVARGASAGGVTSARSPLGADIHALDNAAARAARLIEHVDAASLDARREEIVAALAQTAKPYIGDIEAMTYAELLARVQERCATGRGGRYDDGAWGHPTWRARALDLYRRFAARLHPADAGPIDVPVARAADLDDPAEALAVFRAAFPAAATTLLHPADAQFFLELCDRPGKPVPFVPVLDAELRRWFMADALWQAQDDRHDAGGVFVIPGPRSVAGIERVDEPVAELLARFEGAAIERVLADGAVPSRRERLADPGSVPAPLADAIAGRGGPVAALCGAPSIIVAEQAGVRSRPNPLWRLAVPGDEVCALLDDAGRLERVEVRPAGGAGERLEVAADGDEAVVSVTMPALDGPPAELVTRWRAAGSGSFAAIDRDAGTLAFARHMLGAEAALVPEHPLDEVQAAWSCPEGLAAAHGAATGAEHDGAGVDLALTLAWPAVAGLLSSAPFAVRLAQIVHAGHRVVPGPAWPPLPGEQGQVRARVVLLDDAESAPTRLTCHAGLRCERGELAAVDVELVTPGASAVTDRRRYERTQHRVELTPSGSEAAWLAEREWLRDADLQAGDRVTLEVECVTDRPRAAAGTWRARGRVLRSGEVAGTIDWSAPLPPSSTLDAHPVVRALAALAPAATTRRDRRRAAPAAARDVAPASMDAFARIAGDHNPLHRCVLAARLGGLPRPIVHGAWTAARASAFVVETLCDGDPGALRDWRISFVAPLALGATLELEATLVGVDRGLRVIEVIVSAEDEVVARGEALLAQPPTVLVFTGQGVQRTGLGADGRARSAAARAVWERADAHTRARLGFSLLDVAERNPTELRLASGAVLRHPAGVLHRTELTQPALVTLAAAQLAELHEQGVLDAERVRVAGHSVGEFAALVALGLLELEAAIELVYRRGELMQGCVPRDAAGRSPYAMAVVDPSRAGGVLPAVDGVEIVNENALGRQVGVAGARRALDALAQRLPRGAVRVLDTIDVPFHSSVLVPAICGLRAELERLVGTVDHRRLVGRWVPNLVGRPFSLDDEYLRAAGCEPGGDDPDALARRLVVELLARQVASPVRWVDTQRALVAPAAAGGFAARRIVEIGPAGAAVLTGLMRTTLETLDLAGPPPALLHAEDDRAAVLLAERPPGEGAPAEPPPTEDASAERPPAERASAGPPRAEGASDEPAQPDPGVPVAAPHQPAAPVADRPIDAGAALRLVLAVQARVRPDQLDDDETLDDLFQGASSRRNQVLVDLGRELGLSGSEATTRQPLGEVVTAVCEQAAHYRFPGPYLRDTVASGLARALGRSGLTRADAAARLTSSWNLGPGLTDHALALLALETREGPSARGGSLGRLAAEPAGAPEEGRALVDRAAELMGEAVGLPLSRAEPAAAAPDAGRPASAPSRVERALAESARALLAGLGRTAPEARGPVATDGGRAAAAGGDPAAASVGATPTASDGGRAAVVGGDPAAASVGATASASDGVAVPAGDDGDDPARLAILDAELGRERARQIAPRFDHRRHVRFASCWASARWDLVAAYHAGLRGKLDRDELRRIALHAGDPVLASTARYLSGRAATHGEEDLAAALAEVVDGGERPAAAALPPGAARAAVEITNDGGQAAGALPPAGLRPIVEITDGGRVVPGAEPATGRPLDLLPMLEATGSSDLSAALRAALARQPDLRGETALVTGASPGSIAAALVRRLLRGGATVVVATSTDTPVRRRWYRELYRTSAGPGAELHVLPANLASLADVDALAGWLSAPATGDGLRADLRLDPLHPTIVAPFAAIQTVGELAAAGSEHALRLQLLGVQRLIAAIAAQLPDTAPPAAILLALSPNHGGFGGDGAYGETKAGLEVLLARWRSEHATWGSRVRILAPRIGWVRGTGLMGTADAVAALVEQRLGVRTLSAEEAGWLLSVLAGPGELRERAAHAPIELDLTGGLSAIADLHGAVAPLAQGLHERADAARRRAELDAAVAVAPAPPPPVMALPGCEADTAARAPGRGTRAVPTGVDPADLVVIVGSAELGPCGTAATRFDLELDGAPSAGSVAELAWLCGLVAFERTGYRGRWVDTATRSEVPECELAERYAAAVAARVGIRPIEDGGLVAAAGSPAFAPVALPAELRFEVDTEEHARTFEAAGATTQHDAAGGTWHVLLRAGTQIRVPRTVPHSRRVAGQLPTGLDLARFGIPADLLASADPMALVNLACTTEAFAAAGITPEALLGEVHPALVASTQGCGLGGLASIRRLLTDALLDSERQADRLQESLGNVVGAHAVQSYLGSYGPMVHPVAACATAAVSLEEARDKILAGKALAVLAGGFDDLTPDGLLGFGDMGATAPSDELEALGIAPHEASRPNDVRRRGFVEAQGGGAMLVVRGDVALALGLPVRGVLAYVSSHADGIQASIPAPGMGVLAAALGGPESALARALHRLGLSADDIAVVSKHDTSTQLNDPNEADLHERIQAALGRTPGNPLLVVSQKSVTGHAKGGAAAWQVEGVLQMMERGVVPGNRNLECADPLLRDAPFLTLGDRRIELADREPIRAALVTSLGFGHVSALLAIAHPDVFLATIPASARDGYLRRAARRRAEGVQARLHTRHGRPGAVRRTHRRLDVPADDPGAARDAEAALLTDPGMRLRGDGTFG